jgi:hypothetical protein
MSVIIYAVLPQVLNRFIGFATYQFDANLRNSTMVGIVGAGGIGGTLFAAFQRFDYDLLPGRHPPLHHRSGHAGRISRIHHQGGLQ